MIDLGINSASHDWNRYNIISQAKVIYNSFDIFSSRLPHNNSRKTFNIRMNFNKYEQLSENNSFYPLKNSSKWFLNKFAIDMGIIYFISFGSFIISGTVKP